MFGDFWKQSNNSIKYQTKNMGNELDADLISAACPESISDHPKLALGWLSQFAYFPTFHFVHVRTFSQTG